MRIMSVVGARPQFVKLAPIDKAMAKHADVEHIIVHTGQHYDEAMSDAFFSELGISAPQVNLAVGSDSHGRQTAAMLTGLESTMQEAMPDWVLVYGDTNSTLAAALAAVKLHLPLAHLEAGLRSHNRQMPEEHNRVLTDHAADLLLAPTQAAVEQLAIEGLSARSRLVGDVMTDVCLSAATSARDRIPHLREQLHLPEHFALATIHRAENTDDPKILSRILQAFAESPMPVVIAAHPRLRQKIQEFNIVPDESRLTLIEPQGYHNMIALVLASDHVVTDSGGIQKEAFLLERMCTTIRTETEWPETLVDGWNVLDPHAGHLATSLTRSQPSVRDALIFGDGHAADRVVDALLTGLP